MALPQNRNENEVKARWERARAFKLAFVRCTRAFDDNATQYPGTEHRWPTPWRLSLRDK